MRFSVDDCRVGVEVDAVGVGAAGVRADIGPGVDADAWGCWPGGSALLTFGVPVRGKFWDPEGCEDMVLVDAGEPGKSDADGTTPSPFIPGIPDPSPRRGSGPSPDCARSAKS